MADLLSMSRQALARNQLDKAIQMLMQATSQQPDDPNIWFTLATALARKGGQQTMCCIAYMHTLQLLATDAATQQGPAAVAMASVSADNCWLLAEKLLPTAWPAVLQDAHINSSMCRGLMTHLASILKPQRQQQPAAAAHSTRSPGANTCSSSDSCGGNDRSEESPHVQLLCVGGLGVQAMQLAAAASEAQARAVDAAEAAAAAGGGTTESRGCSTSGCAACSTPVPSMGLAFIPSSQLTAHVGSQLLLDNDLDDIVNICSWPELLQQQGGQQPPAAVLALLAQAVQPNWGPAVAACMQACHRLAAFTTSSTNSSTAGGIASGTVCRLCPARIKVWAVPVSCQELLDLNEVDLSGIAAHTRDRYDYAAANTRLRRSSRSVQVSRHNPQLLAEPVVVLDLSLQGVLQHLQQRYQKPQQQSKTAAATAAAAAGGVDAPCNIAAAFVAGRSAEVDSVLTVQESGQLDCLVWWLEFEWAPGHSTAFTPSAGAAGNKSSSSSSGGGGGGLGYDMLQPHMWQHVQYLQPLQPQQQQQCVTQGQHVEAGQQLLLRATATADALTMTLTHTDVGGTQGTTPQQQQQRQCVAGVEGSSSDGSGQILPYHLSMLNDHARTDAYQKGIAGAVKTLVLQQQQQQQQVQGMQGSLEQLTLEQQQQGIDQVSASGVPVVLDMGCGTGLLSMMAATAAAAEDAKVLCVGCEREPVLAQTAQALVQDNSLQQHVKVVQKLSNALTLPAGGTPPSTSTSAGSKAKGTVASSGKQKQQQQQQLPDLPCKASLVVHEIFGTDPLSEHVLPALKHVQEQLAAPGAVFMPGRVRVVAAVATCSALQQHVRIANTLQPLAVSAAAAGAAPAGLLIDSASVPPAAPPPASTAAGVAVCDNDKSTGSSSSSQPVCQLPGWDVSSLLPMQPRKLEVQLSDLADRCLLLTAPQPVLELNFQQPVQLAGRRKVTLPALGGGLRLQQWMQQQQQASEQQQQQPELQSQSAASASAVKQQELLVVSWFEADCGEGGWLSTAPGHTPLGHWQQSVEFVGHAPAVGPSSSSSSAVEGASGAAAGKFDLQVSWNHDRVSFALMQ